MHKEYYIERQKKWIDEVGLKVGDKVMLVGDPDEWRIERELGTLHPHQLSKGDISQVSGISPEYIMVRAKHDGGGLGNYFPFYVLLKINE